MSRIADMIAKAKELGLTDTQIVGLLQTWTEDEKPRSNNAERQARYRARKAEQTNDAVTSNVTSNATDNVTKAPPSLSPLIPPHTPPYNPPNPPPEKNPRVSVSADFDEFWSIYPRRPGDNRHGAFTKYEAAVRGGADPKAINAAARRFAASVAGQERQFVKGAKVWLHNRCWLDDFPVESNVLPFGHDPPKPPPLTDEEKRELARKFDEDYKAGRIQ